MTRRLVLILAAMATAALAGRPALAQRGAAYCNVTEIRSEQLSNGVRVTIVADGELRWNIDISSLVAEGALVPIVRPYGTDFEPTDKFTRMPFDLYNARSMLGSGFVAVDKYPVSHVEISIPEWAREGVGLKVDVVNYLPWVTGEGDDRTFRYNFSVWNSEDRTETVITWASDRFPPPPTPATPSDLPTELEVALGPGGLRVHAVNAKLMEVANAIAAETGLPISTPADSDLRISLSLHDVSPEEAVGAIAAGCGLCAGRRPDGSWILAGGTGDGGAYAMAETRRIPLRYLRAGDALDLLPNFLLSYLHADREGNAVTVTGPRWMCERVAADLAKLDAAPAEVAVEVVTVEYTSAKTLVRSLRLERLFGDLGASLEALTGDVSFVWLPDLPQGWQLLLESREVEAAGRIHSRATIRVLNGHTGRVFAGQQRNIVLQQIGEGGATASVEAVNIGTTLEVQPRLGDGEEVVLRLNVDVNSLGGTDPETGLPVLLLRSAGARARVRDGETVLIAGVKLSEESRQVRAIPLLGQLPLIGGLFRAPDRVRSEKQLAIFVTPHIIRGEVAKQGVPTYG